MKIGLFFKKLVRLMRKNTGIIALSTVFVILLGTFGSHFVESPVNAQFQTLGDSVWWTMVTMCTVGYGDKVPITTAGRVIGGICMIGGPVLMVSLAGTIGVSLYERWMKGVRGMAPIKKKDHIIICNWNKKAEDIINELQMSQLRELPIIIIDDVIETNPIDNEQVHFVRGNAWDRSILNKANIMEAKYVIVVAGDSTPAADQKTVFTVMIIKKINPNVVACAELIDAKNEDYLKIAGCDVIINSSILSSRLLAMSLQNPSANEIIKELVSQQGHEIYRVAVPEHLIGYSFIDTLAELKKTLSVIAIGIEREGKSMVNPPADELLKASDFLLLISEETPNL